MIRGVAIGKLFLLVLLILLRVHYHSQAQSYFPESHFLDWDHDRNQKLTHIEFYRGLSRTTFFEAWDTNHDGSLVRQEFYDGLEQFQVYFSEIVPPAPVHKVSASANHSLSGEEYSSGLGSIPGNDSLFRKADLNRNGKLNKAEFYTLIFRGLDKDENGYLSPSECTESNLKGLFVQ